MPLFTSEKKGTKAVTGVVPFQKVHLLFTPKQYHLKRFILGLVLKWFLVAYLSKEYRLRNSFCTFYSESSQFNSHLFL